MTAGVGGSTGTGRVETGQPGQPDEGTENTSGFDCPHCGDRFARERYRDLHRGQSHADRLSADERAAYEAALETEREELRLFRLKALAALVLVYFGFLIVYAFSL